MGKTGMTLLIKTAARAQISSKIASLATLLVLLATAARADDVPAAENAMNWAIDHQQEVFDQVMPEPPRYGPDRPERALTFRSEGFEDRFDFLLKVTQREENGAPTAAVIVPDGAPLVVQIARARLAGAPTLEAAIKTIRLKTLTLAPEAAKRIFSALMNICVPLKPQATLIHRDILEVAVVGWSDLHLNVRDDRDRKPSLFGDVFRTVHDALDMVGVTPQDLEFDPRRYYEGLK